VRKNTVVVSVAIDEIADGTPSGSKDPPHSLVPGSTSYLQSASSCYESVHGSPLASLRLVIASVTFVIAARHRRRSLPRLAC
jgi:hypothetical protein